MDQEKLYKILIGYKMQKLYSFIISLFFFLILLILVFFLWYMEIFNLAFFFFILPIGFAIFASINLMAYRKYNQDFKHLLGKVISSLYPNISYEESAASLKNIIIESKLFPIKQDFTFETSDYLIGSFDNYDLYSADICAYHTQGNGENNSTIFAFKGRWTILDIHKKIDLHLIITEKEVGFKSKLDETFTRISTESISFNDKFDVITNHSINAFKLLKPQQIIQIEQLENKYQNKLAMGIYHNQIHFAIFDNVDYFELQTINSLNKIKETINNIIIKANEIYDIFK